jgi:MFS family permease
MSSRRLVRHGPSDDGPAMNRRLALDGLNFCLADSASVLGPFLGVFLLTQYHWNQAAIGLIGMISGLTGIVAQIPMGAAIDATRHKQRLLLVALAAISAAAVAVGSSPTIAVVVVASIIVAVAGAVQGPVIAALTAKLFGRAELARRMGRNGAFDHAGNVFTALAAGAVGSIISQRAVFMLVPLFSFGAAICVLSIRSSEIDQQRARGGRPAASPLALLRHGPLTILAACIGLFHLANAAMLPMVGQRLALAHAGYESAMMSACIVGAQVVMLPVALLCGFLADRIGPKPILIAAFCVLGLRGLLYTLSVNAAWLLGVQLLDGVGAGVLGVMVPLLVADLARGTGRYNLSLGTVATVGGVGAAFSNAAAGAIVVSHGYNAAFIALSAVAFLGLALLWAMLPETADRTSPAPADAVAVPRSAP